MLAYLGLHKLDSCIRSWVHTQSFFPSALGVLVNPFYFARRGLFSHIQEMAPHLKGTILDVGCGQKPYQNLFHADRYVGLEYDTPGNRSNKRADFFYDGVRFPFGADEYDALLVNEVLEHVFNPDEFLDELHRVLKRGGMMLITTPFMWDEHEVPHDYARYSSYGLMSLLKKHHFAVVEHKKSMSDLRAIAQILNTYIFKKTRWLSRGFYSDLFLAVAFMAPVNIAGGLLAKIFPDNEGLYLDNIMLARKE